MSYETCKEAHSDHGNANCTGLCELIVGHADQHRCSKCSEHFG